MASMHAPSALPPNLVVVPFNTSVLEMLQRPIEFAPYASLAFRNVLKEYGMVQSMSGTGNCYEREACPRGTMRRWKVSGIR